MKKKLKIVRDAKGLLEALKDAEQKEIIVMLDTYNQKDDA